MFKMSKYIEIGRNMSKYVWKCQNMSDYVGLCRIMSEYVEICRNMYTIFMYKIIYFQNWILDFQIFFGIFGSKNPHSIFNFFNFFWHHRNQQALSFILSRLMGNWTSQKKNMSQGPSVLSDKLKPSSDLRPTLKLWIDSTDFFLLLYLPEVKF